MIDMKKILLPLVALGAFVAPQSTPVANAVPYCEPYNNMFPVAVGARCYGGGDVCTVYVRYTIDGSREVYCI